MTVNEMVPQVTHIYAFEKGSIETVGEVPILSPAARPAVSCPWHTLIEDLLSALSSNILKLAYLLVSQFAAETAF